jgi:tripartite-type tricarboxylate transporter receptor subunit TctC
MMGGKLMKRMNRAKRLSIIVVLMIFVGFVMPKSGFSDYPERPITIIHGWGPGGMMDIFVRLLADVASKKLGQPIIVESKAGGHGMIATHIIVKSKPDGYTLGGGVSSQFVVIPSMQKVDFDPLNDPTQIMVFLEYTFALVVRSDSQWKTWDELKNYAKQNPGKVSYGSTGVGTIQHLVFEDVAQKEGIKWTNVPFKSGKEAVIAVLGGHVQFAAQGPSDVVEHLKAGELRMLLALNDKRWAIRPNIPHIGELGYDTTFSYFSIWGPKGLPESIRSKLEKVFHDALEDQSVIDAANKFQVSLVYIPGKEYTNMLREKFPKYKKIIQHLGLGDLYKK